MEADVEITLWLSAVFSTSYIETIFVNNTVRIFIWLESIFLWPLAPRESLELRWGPLNKHQLFIPDWGGQHVLLCPGLFRFSIEILTSQEFLQSPTNQDMVTPFPRRCAPVWFPMFGLWDNVLVLELLQEGLHQHPVFWGVWHAGLKHVDVTWTPVP